MRKWSNQDYHSMPWKNGAGSTTELAVFPPGASLDDFVWRLSRAEVKQAGAFSHFAQIDRSLAILSGEGLSLQSDSEQSTADSVSLTQTSFPYQFAGELPIFAELLGGAVLDLNLMTRRDVCQHFMQRLTGGEHYVMAPDAQQILLYCAAGVASLSGESDLGPGDLVLIEEEHEHAGIRLQIAAQEGAILYLMRISFLNQGEGAYAALG
ncbi:HutD family protein [Undibacterium sp. Ren11W]|uniref:HutD/Ves family protein n=1 Tax=Undibacterium sp. Ren11W TaxID=3413045 RepID=UPI003BF20636